MIYAVDRFMDKIRIKKKREDHEPGWADRFTYFDTEEEARAFIRQRADAECAKAEKNLARAIARTKKCQKKFGFKLGDGSSSSTPQVGER